MHVILASVGTDGDIFPYLGLGAVLRARGHPVTLAAPEPYRGRAEAAGIGFCSLVSVADVERMLASPDLFRSIRGGLMMARWGGPMIARQYELLAELAAEPGSVMVANPGLLAARLVQEKLGVPLASLVLQPGIIPSSLRPPEMPGGMTIPGWFPHWLRKAYWWNVDVTGGVLVGRWLNGQRKKLGLRPVRRLFRWWLSPERVIGLFPSWYAEPQTDWPPQMQLAGFGRYDGDSAELSQEIRAFCSTGSRPSVFTLGTGMKDAIPCDLPELVRYVPFAPFRKLLPMCGAIVHHGGIGTTAAALESGCPQLVLPLAWDQPDNAARVTALGVGTSLGMRRRRDTDIAGALKGVLSEEVKGRCQRIAEQARGEDGFEVAAGLVERLGPK
jgi:rhamnosyltransferase subunit B